MKEGNNIKRFKIGYTTGVFDLFHIGHLNLLERAKDQCEYLVVGVSTDELVQEYKHKCPVIPFEDRIKIVSMIRCVDAVVAQRNMNKREAWERIHFDALFHGDDWKHTEMYQRYGEELQKLGGGVKVVYLPHTEGISSTDIKRSMDLRGVRI